MWHGRVGDAFGVFYNGFEARLDTEGLAAEAAAYKCAAAGPCPAPFGVPDRYDAVLKHCL